MKDDAKILFNLKCYLESLLASGQDKICYNDLLYDEKTIDCINAIEDLLKERKKYTIHLTDEEYRKVIENAQMDTSNDGVIAHKFAVMQQQLEQKDKRIQKLEEESRKKSIELICYQEELENSIPTQVVIEVINELKENIKYLGNDGLELTYKEEYQAQIQILQELLGGERK